MHLINAFADLGKQVLRYFFFLIEQLLVVGTQTEQVSSWAELESHHLLVAEFLTELGLLSYIDHSFFDKFKCLEDVVTPL